MENETLERIYTEAQIRDKKEKIVKKLMTFKQILNTCSQEKLQEDKLYYSENIDSIAIMFLKDNKLVKCFKLEL